MGSSFRPTDNIRRDIDKVFRDMDKVFDDMDRVFAKADKVLHNMTVELCDDNLRGKTVIIHPDGTVEINQGSSEKQRTVKTRWYHKVWLWWLGF